MTKSQFRIKKKTFQTLLQFAENGDVLQKKQLEKIASAA